MSAPILPIFIYQKRSVSIEISLIDPGIHMSVGIGHDEARRPVPSRGSVYGGSADSERWNSPFYTDTLIMGQYDS
jgi:hypothetical protein